MPILDLILIGFPVVSCEYNAAAEIPIPCCPLLCESLWNLDPYNNFPNIFGICCFTIPGPLSSIITINLSCVVCLISTFTFGRIFASSHASKALSTPSFIVVDKDFRGLSKPNRCLFFVKNSEIEISLCFFACSKA